MQLARRLFSTMEWVGFDSRPSQLVPPFLDSSRKGLRRPQMNRSVRTGRVQVLCLLFPIPRRGVCNWPSKLQDLKPEPDLVGEITAEAHRRSSVCSIIFWLTLITKRSITLWGFKRTMAFRSKSDQKLRRRCASSNSVKKLGLPLNGVRVCVF